MRLESQLTQLENSQLVHRADDLELAYLFKHTLTQKSAYQSLLQKRRREIHLRVAQAYERHSPAVRVLDSLAGGHKTRPYEW